MLRGLAESGSVCGRIIQIEQKVNANNQDQNRQGQETDSAANQGDSNNHNLQQASSLFTDAFSAGGFSSIERSLAERSITRVSFPIHNQQKKQTRERWVLRILDGGESGGKGGAGNLSYQKKYIQFKERLHTWTTIKQVKQMIHQTKGYHIHRQRLYLNNFELLNYKTLEFYGLLQEASPERTSPSPATVMQMRTVNKLEVSESQSFNLQKITSLQNSVKRVNDQNLQQQRDFSLLSSKLVSQDLTQPVLLNKASNYQTTESQFNRQKNSKVGFYFENNSSDLLEKIQDGVSLNKKVLLLKLAPNLDKLKRLNRQSLQRGRQQSYSSEEEEDQGSDQSDEDSPDNINKNLVAVNQFFGASAPTCISGEHIKVFGQMNLTQELIQAINNIENGFERGFKPKLTDDGTSGTYLLRDKFKKPQAVFKPIDEEAFAPNNPRDHVGPFGSQTFRTGVLSGESSIRELVAYLLDKDGFSGVPATTLVEIAHPSLRKFKSANFKIVSECQEYVDMIQAILLPQSQAIEAEEQYACQTLQKTKSQSVTGETEFVKIGSLQKFVKSMGPIENFSYGMFQKDEIHKIAILDLRILNLDRNECNILVLKKKQFENTFQQGRNIQQHEETNQRQREDFYNSVRSGFSDTNSIMSNQFTIKSKYLNDQVKQNSQKQFFLVPIDHGLSIPDTLIVHSYDLVWLGYSQSEEPFSEKSLNYIRSININEDIQMLERTFKFRPICLRNIKITQMLLKKAAAAGLTLADIGKILCRSDEDDEMPSILEKIVKRARTFGDMFALMQSKIKDSQLRLILPTNYKEKLQQVRRFSEQVQVTKNQFSQKNILPIKDGNFIYEYKEYSPLYLKQLESMDMKDDNKNEQILVQQNSIFSLGNQKGLENNQKDISVRCIEQNIPQTRATIDLSCQKTKIDVPLLKESFKNLKISNNIAINDLALKQKKIQNNQEQKEQLLDSNQQKQPENIQKNQVVQLKKKTKNVISTFVPKIGHARRRGRKILKQQQKMLELQQNQKKRPKSVQKTTIDNQEQQQAQSKQSASPVQRQAGSNADPPFSSLAQQANKQLFSQNPKNLLEVPFSQTKEIWRPHWRKRAYSDVDFDNFSALDQNRQIILQKEITKSTNLKPEVLQKQSRFKDEFAKSYKSSTFVSDDNEEKMKSENKEKQSGCSFSEEEERNLVDESIFKGFEFTAKLVNQIQQKLILQKTKPKQSKVEVKEPISKKQIFVAAAINNQSARKPTFARAIAKYKEKYRLKISKRAGFFSQKTAETVIIQTRNVENNLKLSETALEKKSQLISPFTGFKTPGRPSVVGNCFQYNSIQQNLMLKRRAALKAEAMRRTTSYVNFRISEESDEDDCDNPDIKSFQTPKKEFSELKQNQSSASLLSNVNQSVKSKITTVSKVSTVNNPRKMVEGARKFFGNQVMGDSSEAQQRFIQRRNLGVFSANNNVYKQRKAKQALERDMRWNGPHDEEFFRCFEQYLDDTIAIFVKKKLDKEIYPRRILGSQISEISLGSICSAVESRTSRKESHAFTIEVPKKDKGIGRENRNDASPKLRGIQSLSGTNTLQIGESERKQSHTGQPVILNEQKAKFDGKDSWKQEEQKIKFIFDESMPLRQFK